VIGLEARADDFYKFVSFKQDGGRSTSETERSGKCGTCVGQGIQGRKEDGTHWRWLVLLGVGRFYSSFAVQVVFSPT
jgi:hypothetical protein